MLYGAVAAGHPATAAAAASMLREGGNAFDGALAAMCCACVAEPVLASLGGGGFMLAHASRQQPVLYDFFVQTPCRRRDPAEIDFRPIIADFGDAQQEFHIGLGAMATPGMVKGLFVIHRELCRLPLDMILRPARDLALAGARINRFQHYFATIVEPILRASPAAFALHRPAHGAERLAREGERVPMRDFAETLGALADEGEALFYRGELAERLVGVCREGGGYLTRDDLAGYRVMRREPLSIPYRDAQLLTNPPPSLGGLLIGISLTLMQRQAPPPWGGVDYLHWLAGAMALTQRVRMGTDLTRRIEDSALLRRPLRALVDECLEVLRTHSAAERGTTQISVLDARGNLASMTLSNGEGCGYVLPGTGIMLNNMLGEEDLNPHGFHQWPENRRIASMMAPSALERADGTLAALGSGGSNRIRSAILQVVSNLVDFGMDVERAVRVPRIHYESALLNLEPPRETALLKALRDGFAQQRLWNDCNMFFGGAHTVQRNPGGRFEGMGDPRRGGVYQVVASAR